MAEAHVRFVIDNSEEMRTLLDELARKSALVNGETSKLEQQVNQLNDALRRESTAAKQDASALGSNAAATTLSANATKTHTGYSNQLEKAFQRKMFGARGVTNSMFQLGAAITGVGVGLPALIMGLANAVKGYFEGREAAKKMTAEVVSNSEALQQGGYRYTIYAQNMDEANKKMREFGVGLAAIGGAETARGMARRAQNFEAMLTAQAQALGLNMDNFGKGLKDGRTEIDAIMLAQEQMRVAANDAAAAQEQHAKNEVTWAGQLEKLVTGGTELTEGIAAVFSGTHTVQEAEGEIIYATNTLTDSLNALSKKVGFDVAPAFVLMATSALGFHEQLDQIYPTLMKMLRDKAAGIGTGVVKSQAFGAGLGLGEITGQFAPAPGNAPAGVAAKKEAPQVPGGLVDIPWLPGLEEAQQGIGGIRQDTDAEREERAQHEEAHKKRLKELDDEEKKRHEEIESLQTSMFTAASSGLADGIASGLDPKNTEPATKKFGKMMLTIIGSVMSLALATIPIVGPGLAALSQGLLAGLSNRLYTGGVNTGGGWVRPAAEGIAFDLKSPTVLPGLGGPPVLAGERGHELLAIMNERQEQNLTALARAGQAAMTGAGQPSINIYPSGYIGGDDMPGRIHRSHLQGQSRAMGRRL